MTFRNRQRLKLMVLIAVFFLPLLGAWGMLHWQAGIPAGRTAHGQLMPPVPPLSEWPLADKLPISDGQAWWLVFDCEADCKKRADQWWRMHRALGRQADRVTRLRIGGNAEALPGGNTTRWSALPDWRDSSVLWILDPQGRVVLAYPESIEPAAVLEDMEQLLKVNPGMERHGT
ncbi:hypothetical protein FGL86_12980 [Pistricoccus aurantiacus]|uniref:Thioredoxin domain-containing protein n=1 Tax=Pistricoccus aurantiacus TaxID=1883414 RepID=A0A5B8SYK0_9GAMM|nr:hypothetical protein [Pistricoccus aurantiacus]QEA39890.1 hypothetical protein FGL86_12980 [Pistricoccus aurantiacus]